MLRRRISDSDSTLFSDTPLELELLSAARFISQEVELRSIFPRALTKSQTLTVVAGTLAYQLNTDFVVLRRARRTDGPVPIECHEIDVDDIGRWEESAVPIAPDGRPIFYLSTDSTGVLTFNFPSDPKTSMTISVEYQKTIADVADGASYAVPDALHELIVLYAAIQLLGSDAANGEALAAVTNDYNARRDQMKSLLRRTKRPLRHSASDGIVG